MRCLLPRDVASGGLAGGTLGQGQKLAGEPRTVGFGAELLRERFARDIGVGGGELAAIGVLLVRRNADGGETPPLPLCAHPVGAHNDKPLHW